MKKLTVGSLFSGIGGLELGLERTGKFKTIWFSEIEPYPAAVLKQNFPRVPNLGDITKIRWGKVRMPDMLCGGFPCQDISVAGKRKGIQNGTKSSLWKYYEKAIRELRPDYALVENVPNLVNLGLDVVLADLASMGYDAEWGCLSASETGACHKRERLFVFAYANGTRFRRGNTKEFGQAENAPEIQGRSLQIDGSNSDIVRLERQGTEQQATRTTGSVETSYNRGQRIQRFWQGQVPQFPEFSWCKDVRRIEDLRNRPDLPEPLVRRKSHGLSNRLDNYIRTERIKALGNAVVPQVAETVGNWILSAIRGRTLKQNLY